MYRLTITPRLGTGPLLKPGEAARLAFEKVEAALWESVQYLQESVKEATPVGVFGEEGGLRGSIFGKVTGASLLELKGVVSSAAKYAEPVELGTRPHWLPVAAIPALAKWAQVKLGKTGPEAVQMAWGIRGTIAKRGTRGHFMFAHTLALSEAKLAEIWDRAGYDLAIAWDGA
jgi:hypothetical protein